MPSCIAIDVTAIDYPANRPIDYRDHSHHRVLSEASGTCVFLDPRTKGCGIYDVRPTQCRNFPFTPGKDSPIATRSQWNTAREHCPGIGIGRYYDKRHIRKLVRGRAQHGSFQV